MFPLASAILSYPKECVQVLQWICITPLDNLFLYVTTFGISKPFLIPKLNYVIAQVYFPQMGE